MWVLDGYNCIKRSALWTHDSLEKARAHLVAVCNGISGRRVKDRDFLIVFDGRGGEGPFEQREGRVRVVFACGMSADAYIKRWVETHPHPARIRVVTDDKAVGYYIRALGAGWVSVREFFDKSPLAGKASQASYGPPEKDLTPEQIALINEELQRRWGKGQRRSK